MGRRALPGGFELDDDPERIDVAVLRRQAGVFTNLFTVPPDPILSDRCARASVACPAP
jgi:hypothetical protein